VVLRAPGIYAQDRLPLERLRAGTPVLRAEDDVFTNHIHAEDLAAACVRTLEEDAPAGIYNASDDTQLRMGEWFDLVADRAGLPRPPRIARADATGRMPPELLSFMNESRRLDNTRLKTSLGIRLRYATVREGLEHAHLAGAHQPA
jgi:nucleoside-diphosphate-sugar epimerase